MKDTHISFPVVMLWLVFAGFPGIAQPLSRFYPKEQLSLQTDRTMYVAGEPILFASCLLLKDEPAAGQESKVLYCELLTPGGRKIAGGKFLIENRFCSAKISIPLDIITGIYYLRTYTKSMRNEGPHSYSYVQLRIINPARQDVMKTDEKTLRKELPDSVLSENQAVTSIKISTSGKSYPERQEAAVLINDQNSEISSFRNLSLSIIPESTFSEREFSFPATLKEDKKMSFYPETIGISVSGRLINKQSGASLPSTRINLSVIGEKDFMAVLTDSTGSFHFSLPGITGKRDLFLCSENLPGVTASLLVENDFCPVEISLPSPPFTLTESERKAALNLAVNAQVSSLFRDDTASTASTPIAEDHPFYGKPTEILKIDKYVLLPSLEEYFNELPCAVKIRRQQGKPYFKFSGVQSEMNIYDPLVMIDWVVVDDMEKILAIAPQLLDRIEFVNAPYIKGNFTYGGIVSIISRQKDFAGIDLPSSGIFLNYEFLSPKNDSVPSPEISTDRPDARNTLYWNPDLKHGNNTPDKISFTTPDCPGNYMAVLRGLTREGKTMSWRSYFIVK